MPRAGRLVKDVRVYHTITVIIINAIDNTTIQLYTLYGTKRWAE